MLVAQYAKWPVLGKVKTRIGRTEGSGIALSIHMELVDDIMNRFASRTEFAYQLWLDHFPESLSEFDVQSEAAGKQLQKRISQMDIACRIQQGACLGERMCHTFNTLAPEYEKIAIVGSDCPNVPRAVINDVELALDKHDIVLIPAVDGGYVLIAVNAQSVKGLEGNWLEGVEWGSSHAFEQTLDCCERLSLDVAVFEESWDVDEIEDYKRWKQIVE